MFSIGTPIGLSLVFKDKEELVQVTEDLRKYVETIKEGTEKQACVFMIGDIENHNQDLRELAYYFKNAFTDKVNKVKEE